MKKGDILIYNKTTGKGRIVDDLSKAVIDDLHHFEAIPWGGDGKAIAVSPKGQSTFTPVPKE